MKKPFCNSHFIVCLCVHWRSNLHHIINLLKRYKLPSNFLCTYAEHRQNSLQHWYGKKFRSQHVLMLYVHVGSGRASGLYFNWLHFFTGYLIFVCDCCRNFLLPIGAVGRNSFTAQREKLQNVYRKRNHFEGFGVQQTCWEFHWAKIEKLFFLSVAMCTTTLHYWKINNKSTHLGAWILRKIIYIRPEGKVFPFNNKQTQQSFV